MSVASLEREILAELKRITGRKDLRMKDLLEWSSAPIKKLEPGEVQVAVPSLGVYCAIPEPKQKGAKEPDGQDNRSKAEDPGSGE